MLGPDVGFNTVAATVDGVDGAIIFTTTTRSRPAIIATYDLVTDPLDATASAGQLILGDDGSLEVGLSYTTSPYYAQPFIAPTVWSLLSYSVNGSAITSRANYPYYPYAYGDLRADTLVVVTRFRDDEGFVWDHPYTFVRSAADGHPK
jgi:hypothetical protein